MLRAVANLKYFAHVRWFVWSGVIFLMLWALLVEWHRVNEEAERTQVKLLAQSMSRSASSLRQKWELENKPSYSKTNGIDYSFTHKGWPIIIQDDHVDCAQMWDLLSSRQSPVDYISLIDKKNVRSERYNSCYFQITDGKWLALFYENETIHTNSFLTLSE
ncbi:hypothetical protein [Photobacterium rosenbergii]|uniref:MSHA biogenesis protein MshF n=1 Tax=Photobacterium rosenbergii TaxID=294936 RepID=A0ABU3ZLV3_9GAMM|nr:hypothetical protein [Photobacterium rosenbergii]MDV5170948.1 hypothetical protein [Photobacterium rosenbergii]